MKNARVFWFTGLSGSGKTRIAETAANHFLSLGRTVRILDGDVVRETINPHLTFSPEDIRENNRIIAGLCLQALPLFDLIFVPIIAPFEESRAHAKGLLGEAFRLVYVKASLAEVKRRDVKGLYAKAAEGKIENFIGIAIPYEPPAHADLVLDTENSEPSDSIAAFIRFVTTCEQER